MEPAKETAVTELSDAASLEHAVSAPLFLLFKHSRICPVSARAFRQYESFVADHPAAPTAFVDVVALRPAVRGLAERSGVRHESPQAILFESGEPRWHASHGDVTAQGLASALAAAQSGT